jgi:transcription antitermination factor NusA-like protein
MHSYHAYLSEEVFILRQQQYPSPVVALHDRLKCWEQQYQCQTISKVTLEATSIEERG